jgi:hypothetical protein
MAVRQICAEQLSGNKKPGPMKKRAFLSKKITIFANWWHSVCLSPHQVKTTVETPSQG